MSDFQRSFAKAKLARLPAMPPVFGTDAGDEQAQAQSQARADDSSSASSAESTGTIKPPPGPATIPHLSVSKQSLDPIPWTASFAQELDLDSVSETEHVVHHVYFTAPAKDGPLFVMHHGAGSSGLSFAALANELKQQLPKAGIMSVDARGHGSTIVKSSSIGGTETDEHFKKPLDLSLNTLSNDLINALNLSRERLGWSEFPGMVLVGHSLGGPIVTEVAKRGVFGASVLGYAVLDVVEGSAMDALKSMQQYLSTRPSSFPSIAAGIEWHVRSRTIRNMDSARASVPPQLHQTESDKAEGTWSWRTDLSATKLFWEDWFTGLSKKFLEAKGGKLLLLAGTDRLDKELMIGQMQGKYQLQVFPEAGHFIQEDAPEKTATVLVDFFRRNDRSSLVLPPKVSDMLKNNPGKKI